MTKATHTGTCQCCGATQKLPNGKLSKHGYTIDNGWFQGTCYGAGHLPFEQSKDLIEGLIESAQEHIEKINAEIEELKASTDHTKAWRHAHADYQLARQLGRRSGYYWEQREIYKHTRDDGYQSWKWKFSDDEPKGRGFNADGCQADYRAETLEDATRYQNGLYIKSALEPQIRQAQQYIQWQQERIANWKPTELTEI